MFSGVGSLLAATFVFACASCGESPPIEGPSFAQVAAGGPGQVCGLDHQGAIFCTGSTPPAAAGFARIETGFAFGCGLRDEGTVECWGLGAGLQLPGTYVEISAAGGFGGGPRAVCGLATGGAFDCVSMLVRFPPIPAGDIAAVSTSGPHLCAVYAGSGAVECVGDPVLSPPIGSFTALSVGYNSALGAEAHACGIRSEDASVACWGKNEFGESDPPTGVFRSISVGRDHSCAIRVDDKPVCWGANDFGQSSPPSGALLAQLSAAVVNFTCGVTVDGKAICWGDAPQLPSTM